MQTAELFLAMSGAKHHAVRHHGASVALLAERTAHQLRVDKKAAFFAGLLHDIGKLMLPYRLFDGKDITQAEYEEVKSHAMIGFTTLKDIHLFTALCAGLHHALYRHGYGLCVEDFPSNWNPATIKKVLEIAAIVSICDFIDAYTTRTTQPRGMGAKNTGSLLALLIEKYPNDRNIIDAALAAHKQLFKNKR
jgi:putative nucleotidyltransferase with HDIG domain